MVVEEVKVDSDISELQKDVEEKLKKVEKIESQILDSIIKPYEENIEKKEVQKIDANLKDITRSVQNKFSKEIIPKIKSRIE